MKGLSSLLRRAWRTPTARRMAIVLLLVVGYQAWLGIQAAGKVASGVGDQRDVRGRFAVNVELDFAPERYHILELQKHGRIAGTDGNTVRLRSVSKAGVNALAREYWIERIAPGR
ncbi:hypothetical protein [Micromonospora sp. U21]|uniref:hypothetical protein n=1 Tax=Micromonospora sp. U21 TaxID=2824899 RepID=UPI001B37075D|nr:hypothetical protein [Micromonospora sp. U21]MBQ0901990.1 hypothetical protein [Micromonospora sp. U21]